ADREVRSLRTAVVRRSREVRRARACAPFGRSPSEGYRAEQPEGRKERRLRRPPARRSEEEGAAGGEEGAKAPTTSGERSEEKSPLAQQREHTIGDVVEVSHCARDVGVREQDDGHQVL